MHRLLVETGSFGSQKSIHRRVVKRPDKIVKCSVKRSLMTVEVAVMKMIHVGTTEKTAREAVGDVRVLVLPEDLTVIDGIEATEGIEEAVTEVSLIVTETKIVGE